MELRRAGFSEAEIRARQNELRQNSAASTARALKEHFILERIAEEEKIEAEEGDFEQEIFLIAMQSGESPRRVRAQIEKRGLMDVLQNQIVERKVLERVQAEAKFKDVPYEPAKVDAEAISMAAGGDAGRDSRGRRSRRADEAARRNRLARLAAARRIIGATPIIAPQARRDAAAATVERLSTKRYHRTRARKS